MESPTSGTDKSTTCMPPSDGDDGIGTSSEGGEAVDTGTDSTERSTVHRPPSSPDRSSYNSNNNNNSNSNGVDNELKEGMANLNVSPPRPGASGSVFTLTTPLTTPQNREGSGIDAMTSSGAGLGAKGSGSGSVGLLRQRSSPSLIDASPPKPKNNNSYDASASKSSRMGQPPLAISTSTTTTRIAYSPKPSPSISMTTTTTTTTAATINSDTKLSRHSQLQFPQRPHHELTPVTRNTTYVSDEQYVENASSNLISPDELKQAADVGGGANTHIHPVRKSGGVVDDTLVFPSEAVVKNPTNSTPPPPLQQRLSQKHSSANNNNTTAINSMDTAQNTIHQGNHTATTSETPYLPPTIISMSSRAKSVGNLDSHSLMLATKPGTKTDSWDYAADVEHDLEGVEEEEQGHRGPPFPTHHLPPRQQHPHDPPAAMYHPAIQFPPRQYYSFTSRQQYETSIQEESAEMTGLEKTEGGSFIMSATSSDDAAHPMEGAGAPSVLQLKPYQPDRHDLDQVGVRKDDANLLFRGKENNVSNNALRQPISMEDRQYSIPSIRMAHHVNGSMASYTDEEDDLMFRGYDDDASLSSRGSSLYLPEDMAAIPSTASGVGGLLGSTSIVNDDDEEDDIQGVQKNTSWPVYNMQQKTSVIIEDGLEKVVHPSTSNIMDASAMAIAPSARVGVSGSGTSDTDNSSSAAGGGGGSRKNKRKQISQEERTLKAYQWINSIQLPAEQNVFAEAASSKFLLTGRQPPVQQQQQQQNLSSTGVATSTEVIGGIHRRRIPPTPTAPAIADS
eukprot:CAMPEP_0195284102 /NCGR_PEP_ID=MMETSP0707-20130614/2420_1 /TAXON_ID=33640 /ORGANISM="Asterionellopsis glacialis, Strain CCMP134" /LENGTH=788 /DNA_ID=CAMNT_0040343397 /DNA_START=136 /DNA_END=2502 /DNA_ORIENTATION=+